MSIKQKRARWRWPILSASHESWRRNEQKTNIFRESVIAVIAKETMAQAMGRGDRQNWYDGYRESAKRNEGKELKWKEQNASGKRVETYLWSLEKNLKIVTCLWWMISSIPRSNGGFLSLLVKRLILSAIQANESYHFRIIAKQILWGIKLFSETPR